ncbi:MAG: Holliday junction branch migration protein RuvA [Holosporales bacterium]|jgi:Holliday junction DNA helicase RuvA|nr:Holliday junction branch migration protein RuvA [Holosporales bacterium]
MIVHLKGTVVAQKEDTLILDVYGVGHKVTCTRQMMENAVLGTTLFVLTEMIIREDGWFLYGFADENERETFRLLTSVQGIGPKVALMILSALGVQRFYEALFHQESAVLCQAEGVGPKLARRLINELKDKCALPNLSSTIALDTQTSRPVLQDVLSALSNLGYKRAEAFEVVRQAGAESQQASFEELFRESLKRLSQSITPDV